MNTKQQFLRPRGMPVSELPAKMGFSLPTKVAALSFVGRKNSLVPPSSSFLKRQVNGPRELEEERVISALRWASGSR